MIAIAGNEYEKEIRILRGSLLHSGYPVFSSLGGGDERSSASLAVIVFDRRVPPGVDPERVVLADASALSSDLPGTALFECERVRSRVEEVIEIKNGIRFENFSSKLYAERNGISVFLGETLPLTEREKLIVRLLSVYPSRFLTVREIADACYPDHVGDSAVRTAVYEINKRAKELTGFPLIAAKPNAGYSFAG
ncbi:MAG: helix-turn-helix domain-containing protein [Clostridia bacterium]|nr:helix-turn-helix domain-containing protein [Clostridia bacterium]